MGGGLITDMEMNELPEDEWDIPEEPHPLSQEALAGVWEKTAREMHERAMKAYRLSAEFGNN